MEINISFKTLEFLPEHFLSSGYFYLLYLFKIEKLMKKITLKIMLVNFKGHVEKGHYYLLKIIFC